MNGVSAAALSLGLLAMPAFGQGAVGPELTFYGRASVKIRTAAGTVLYIDPYEGDYSEPADIVLVTHGHTDHNAVAKVVRKPGCIVAAPPGAVSGKIAARAVAEGQSFEASGIKVEVLPAYNKNHSRDASVGYVLEFDGIVLYHSGDTNRIPEMEALAKRKIDWALLCTDGFWNMGAAEAADCAKLVGARRSIPIHSSPTGLHSQPNAAAYAQAAAGGVVVPVGGSIALKP
jgi:L-ascorbate metabolism protein UlaG (beta-lactamase superfamily)